jgi:hypothetical protein
VGGKPGERRTCRARLPQSFGNLPSALAPWPSGGRTRWSKARSHNWRTPPAEVVRAWSGSSFGFHSRVYYADLEPPPPGAHFSSECGFQGQFQGTTGDWREHPHDEVVRFIRAKAGDPDLLEARAASEEAQSTWREVRSEVVSILTAYLAQRSDALLEEFKKEAEAVRDFSAREAARAM